MSLAQGDEIVKSETVSQDAFLGGKIQLFQPKTGFRAGSDSVLLGASIAHTSQHILDLGSGVGGASLCALARVPSASAMLVEIDQGYIELANKNIAANGFLERASIVQLDATATGAAREAAGIEPDHYSSVIANPPYYEVNAGTPAREKSRADARAMPQDMLDDWVRTAAAAAAPGGEIILIYRASGLAKLLSAFNRFGAVTILPIAARPGEHASRILVRGIKGSRAPLTIKPPLYLHGEAGNAYTPQISAILREGAMLHW